MTDWKSRFRELYERTLRRMETGERDLERLFDASDRQFLRSIGSKPIELFDACDDFLAHGEPSPEEILRIHEIRRDHFLRVQAGQFPPLKHDIRDREAKLGGIPWLPRAIDKARAKLEGRLPDDFFYPCAGDRRMLRELGLGRVEFFEIVRDNPTDAAVLAEVNRRRHRGSRATDGPAGPPSGTTEPPPR